ncbi:hypothetical protein RHGRI_020841 [Rhododendron griersonianum]|uniref:Uncharacterized protein n=1 Tax=Rhododendron griersonianum TaxID=479676 RepID=A0AAV6JKW6_9ERIC|nr:hypothetical protein RHGRI_020841 [Rhododendron griersonianum]
MGNSSATKQPSSDRKRQQVLFEEGLKLEAEERARQKNEPNKLAVDNPQTVVEESEDELEQVLESIVSSSQATLSLTQNEESNHKSAVQVTAIPAEQEEVLEEFVKYEEVEIQQLPSTYPMQNGSAEVFLSSPTEAEFVLPDLSGCLSGHHCLF